MNLQTQYTNLNSTVNVSSNFTHRQHANVEYMRLDKITRTLNDKNTILSDPAKFETKMGWAVSNNEESAKSDRIAANTSPKQFPAKDHSYSTPQRESRAQRKIIALGSVLVLITLLLIWRAAYLSLGAENRNRTNLILMTVSFPDRQTLWE